jgi:hypothetical protein
MRNKALRVAIQLAVTVAAVYALRALVWWPLRCSVVEKDTRLRMEAIEPIAETLKGYRVARSNYETMVRAFDECPPSLDVPMLAAANAQLFNDKTAVLLWNERALTVDRRPELYINLALSQIEAGDVQSAVKNFAIAIRFDPHSAEMIGEPRLAALAAREAAAQTAALARARGRAAER